MKIAHLAAPGHAGGLERVIHALAIGQRRRGDEILVIPVVEEWTAEHPFGAPLVRAGVAIRPIVVPHRAYLRERAELGRLFRAERPDVVHTHSYHADVLGGDVARRAGCATVSTAHGFTRGGLKNRLYELIGKRAQRGFDAVVAVSRPLAQELEASGVPAERIHVVANAWSSITEPVGRAAARAELGLDPAGAVIGWVGRMSHEKGLDVMVEALAHLRDLPVVLCAVGDGPERAPQAARAAELGVAGRIRWPGLVREAGRYFAAFDAFVLSSRTEGIPMVLLEALAAGVPVVATAVGGIPEVVSPAEAALVPPERPAELAAAIRSALARPEDAAARARRGLSRLEREFAEGPWLDGYAEAYRSALTRAAARVTRPSGGSPRAS